MRRLATIMCAHALALGAVVVAAPTASAASDMGITTFRVNHDAWNSIVRAGVGLYGGDPAGGTLVSPGRPAMEIPVKTLKSGVATHDGNLTFTRADSMYLRTAVLDDIVFDFGKKKATARVYATDTDLGKKTMFTLAHVKNDSGMYDFTLKLTADGAATLNSSLNVTVFASGMRVGSGMTMMMPPS